MNHLIIAKVLIITHFHGKKMAKLMDRNLYANTRPNNSCYFFDRAVPKPFFETLVCREITLLQSRYATRFTSHRSN